MNGALSRNRGCGTLLAGLLLASIVVGAIYSGDDNAPPPAFGRMEALDLCQRMIAAASINPAAAVVPYVRGSEDAGSWTFLWRRADSGLQLQTAAGSMRSAQVLCKVDRDTHTVRTLAIDGVILR